MTKLLSISSRDSKHIRYIDDTLCESKTSGDGCSDGTHSESRWLASHSQKVANSFRGHDIHQDEWESRGPASILSKVVYPHPPSMGRKVYFPTLRILDPPMEGFEPV